MPSLQEFASTFQIDQQALSRIKRRLFVVGRFNQNPIQGDPEIYLFTNKPASDLTEIYKRNFPGGILPLRYDDFIQALHPAIAEKIEDKEEGVRRFSSISLTLPTGEEGLQGASVIDTFNYFYNRAVGNSDQPRFKKQDGNEADLLQHSDKDRGKSILKQIRTSLQAFCNFQPRCHEIVEAFVQLLDKCGMENSLPYFAAGGPLPGGFPEKLIDFIYAENSHARFDATGLDFSKGEWRRLRKDEKALETFCSVVSAFRDALFSNPAYQYDGIHFGGRSLTELAVASVPEDLATAFHQSRKAFNSLRQILRSKVLLSMVLEWLLSTYYDLDPVAKIDPDNTYKRDQKVEDLVLKTDSTEWKKSGIAAPIKRPSKEERRRFSKLLTDNFEHLLQAILAPDAEVSRMLDPLPDELKNLANDLRRDKQKRDLLAAISGAQIGDEFHKAFLDAAKTVLLDVLCPTLYRNPNVTAQELKRYFRQEIMSAYLTAVFLDDKHQDEVQRIAERHISFFESKIDEATKEIHDVDQLLKVLLTDFMDFLAGPEVQRRLGEGFRVLRGVLTLLDAEEVAKGRGAGSISAILPSDLEGKRHEGSLEETSSGSELVPVLVQTRVGIDLKKSVADAASAKPKVTEAGSQEKSDQETESAESAADAAMRLDKKIDNLLHQDREIDELLQKLETQHEAAKEVTTDQILEWTNKISTQILSDEEFVGGLTEDLRAFERTLHLIYSRYEKNPRLVTFRNKVERMTLINMMLLFQRDLDLGRSCSNLYQFLLDLVLHLDPHNIDPMDFLREKSLTLYFDDADLDNGGIGELRELLRSQATSSLQNIVKFISELRGVNYLMDSLDKDPDSEIVVVNATIDEFWSWLQRDDLTSDTGGYGRFRSSQLITSSQSSEKVILPGLVYLTDLAFPKGDVGKEDWLGKLTDKQFANGQLRLIPPPFCLSTPPQDSSGNWSKSGAKWAELAARAPAPIVIVGPSPHLNREGDGFPTFLPAGYLLGAHILSPADPLLKNDNVGVRSHGRFRVLTSAPMRESLDCALWGDGTGDSFALSVDLYLFLILTMWSCALGRQGALAEEFFLYFFHEGVETFGDIEYETSNYLNSAVIGGDAYRFALGQKVSYQALRNAWLARQGGPNLIHTKPPWQSLTDFDWFNQIRAKADLWTI